MVVIHNTNNYISTNNIVETADVTNISPPHKIYGKLDYLPMDILLEIH